MIYKLVLSLCLLFQITTLKAEVNLSYEKYITFKDFSKRIPTIPNKCYIKIRSNSIALWPQYTPRSKGQDIFIFSLDRFKSQSATDLDYKNEILKSKIEVNSLKSGSKKVRLDEFQFHKDSGEYFTRRTMEIVTDARGYPIQASASYYRAGRLLLFWGPFTQFKMIRHESCEFEKITQVDYRALDTKEQDEYAKRATLATKRRLKENNLDLSSYTIHTIIHAHHISIVASWIPHPHKKPKRLEVRYELSLPHLHYISGDSIFP